jgi:hypothetical protein
MQIILAIFLTLMFALPANSCRNQSVSNKTGIGSDAAKPLATEDRVRKGKWGGQHVRLEVSENGAEFEFDCAHGRLSGPLTLQQGRFAATGNYVRERGRVSLNPEAGQPVYFKGQVDGSRMTLRFSLAEDGSEEETFTLTYGAEAKVFKCK